MIASPVQLRRVSPAQPTGEQNELSASYSQSSGAGVARAPSYGWSLLEVAALFLVLAAPPVWIGLSDIYVLVPLAVAAAYVIGTPIITLLGHARGASSRLRFASFALAQLAGGCAAVAGFSMLLATAWIDLAYRKEIISPSGMGLGWAFELETVAPLTLALIGVAVLMFFASATLLRRDGEGFATWIDRLRNDGLATLWLVAASWLVLGFAVLGLADVAASAFSLPVLLQAANPAEVVDIWAVAKAFPGLPFALLAVSVLLVSYRRIQGPALASLQDPQHGSRVRLPAVSVVVASIAGGYAWFLYTLHVGFVAALGTVSMIVSWGEVTRATDAWIDAQQEAGRAPAEIAAELREHGSWTIEGPALGRSSFDPRLGGTLGELGLSSSCTVTIDAGIADNSALRHEDWIAGYVAGFRPLPDVSYCIRLACPSPAVWQDRPVIILHSSHPSRNPYWAYNLFMDVFGAGAAPNAGGYCTAGGRLAARYQG